MEDNQIEQFEQFYFRKMRADEAVAFEKKLNSDENLSREYSAFVLAKEAIEGAEAQSLRDQMKSWQDEVKPGSTPDAPGQKNSRWGLLFLLLALVAIFYFSCPMPSDSVDNSSHDWQAYATVHIRGIERSAEEISPVQRANQMYLDENYEELRAYLAAAEDSLRVDPKMKLLEALLMYQGQNFAGAKEKFELILEAPDVPFMVADAAMYFSLLSQARLDSCGEVCQTQLRQMSEDDNFLYKNQASLLLDRVGTRD